MFNQKFHIFILVLCYLISRVTCEKEIKVPIVETLDQKYAEKIFLSHGIRYWQNKFMFIDKTEVFFRILPMLNAVRSVCKSIDGKTNRIYGEAICTGAGKKLFGVDALVFERVTCEEQSVKIQNYDHEGEPTDVTRTYVKVAKCIYERSGKKDQFFISNGPKFDFYYAYAFKPGYDSLPHVLACLNIIPKLEDIPKVEVHETNNSLEADDIFGVYGQNLHLPSYIVTGNIKNHICRNVSGNLTALSEQTYCRSAMRLEPYKKFSLNTLVQCTKARVIRQIANIDESDYLVLKPQYMIKCNYDRGSFMILNGPTDSLYYIAENAIVFSKDPLLVYIKAVIHIPLPDYS